MNDENIDTALMHTRGLLKTIKHCFIDNLEGKQNFQIWYPIDVNKIKAIIPMNTTNPVDNERY